ncbi:MAG: ABC transporter permease [Chloroflexi bacterium]|nr:ABC transporter permease [Chloroflexota bacterium]MCI0645837.1 ABC transporter permease [Chloroflexota bacterium]MCI0725692.1 ABC transporter permease [Chloroflexota bacterium]
MRKIWAIALKDTLVRFRDRNALILMLAAPLALSAIVGAAFGGFITNANASPIRDIPLIVVNGDQGVIGQRFLAVLNSPELAELLEPSFMDDLDEARQIVARGEVRAVVYIPPSFSETIEYIDTSGSVIQIYTDPSATITPLIIRSVMTQIANGFSSVGVSTRVTAEQISDQADILGAAMAELGPVLQEEIEINLADEDEAVTESLTTTQLNWITTGEGEGGTADANPLAFFAPSMGIFFLMFTVMRGARSILDEQVEGTLDRLISTPTGNVEILLGKIGGTLLTGILQFAVFVVASQVIFSLDWGESLPGLVIMTLVVVFAFTSLGAVIAAFVKDTNQAATLGSIVILVSAALGGNFVPATNYPEWLQQLSKITINRWALDGFADLTMRGLGLTDIVLEVGILFLIAVALLSAALWQFQRRIAR